jgi:hypothetical protein
LTNTEKIAINIISFQIGWFACVIMASRNMPEAGILVSLFLIGIQLFLDKNPKNKLLLLMTVGIIGLAWDSLLTATEILVFDTGMIAYFLAPGWILVMWLIFATTLDISFRWLFGRYWIAMLLGAICGPLAYQAGSALGAVDIPNDLVANTIMAAGWAVIMPLLIRLAEYFDNTGAAKVKVS